MFIYHIKKRCKFLNLSKKNYTFSAILTPKKSKMYSSFEATTSYIAMQKNIVEFPFVYKRATRLLIKTFHYGSNLFLFFFCICL